MKFDYFSCIQCNVIVSTENLVEHNGHDFIGEFFVIKQSKKKVLPGLISKKLINAEQDKLNVIKFEKREALDKKKKVLAQERYQKQIPDGDVIVNLAEMKV